MEQVVQLGQPVHIGGSTLRRQLIHPARQVVQRAQLDRAVGRGQPASPRLEHGPQAEDLVQVANAPVLDLHAAVPLVANQALRGQSAQGFPDGSAAHAGRPRQLALAQPFAACPPAGEDLVADQLVGVVGGMAVVGVLGCVPGCVAHRLPTVPLIRNCMQRFPSR